MPFVPSVSTDRIQGALPSLVTAGASPAPRVVPRGPWRSALAALTLAVLAGSPVAASARDFFVDAAAGSDAGTGTSPASAWRSLERAAHQRLTAGDRLLLKRGIRISGTLDLTCEGAAGQPVTIGAYGDVGWPVIDAAGRRAALRLANCRYVVVEGIELTADGGAAPGVAGPERTAGVLVENSGGPAGPVTLRNLRVHDIFASRSIPDEGAGAVSNQGFGIEIRNSPHGGTFGHIEITDCAIERTGRTGISLGGGAVDDFSSYLFDVTIANNVLTDIGGPGINPRLCRHLVVRGNTVNRSGSSVDSRMHRRGSGIWPWHCDDVLIEHNRFMHARGPGDSCGMHIDFGCRDVIVQYNLSLDNEGGFVEILGDNFNCAYRYNISVNDGARVKGVHGALQEGKVLWFSGYVGPKRARRGPTDCYIYNNTVYVGPGGRSCFAIGSTTHGVLIANNIFVLRGPTVNVPGDQESKAGEAGATVPNAVMTHNLYVRPDVLPVGWPLHDDAPAYGDPSFARPSGDSPADYVPQNAALVCDGGIVIPLLPGDQRGLRGGLAVARDFLGHAVVGRPDLGAIELPAAKPESKP